jgi:hypothetical protein
MEIAMGAVAVDEAVAATVGATAIVRLLLG